MNKRLQKTVSMITATFFLAGSIFCCCLTKNAQAAQTQDISHLPPCHQKAAQEKSRSQQEDCDCLITKLLLADSILKAPIVNSFHYQLSAIPSLVSTFTLQADHKVSYLNTGPPILGQPVALYIRYSNLRI